MPYPCVNDPVTLAEAARILGCSKMALPARAARGGSERAGRSLALAAKERRATARWNRLHSRHHGDAETGSKDG